MNATAFHILLKETIQVCSIKSQKLEGLFFFEDYLIYYLGVNLYGLVLALGIMMPVFICGIIVGNYLATKHFISKVAGMAFGQVPTMKYLKDESTCKQEKQP